MLIKVEMFFQDFLLLSEIEPKRELLENFNGRSTIRTEKITASWLDDGTMETLSKVNVTISDKDLCAIVGSVGAGKVFYYLFLLKTCKIITKIVV